MKESRQRKGSAKAPKALQAVIVKHDREVYRNLRSNLAMHGITVTSYYRKANDSAVYKLILELLGV